MIVSSVGEDYFREHFKLRTVEVLNSTDGDWFAQVGYLYDVEAGNYSYTCGASVVFSEKAEVIHTEGIPLKGNLMPFKITRDQAIAIAMYVTKPNHLSLVDARISYIGTFTITPRIDKYAWVVQFDLRTSTDSYGNGSGIMTDVIIDAYTGYVYRVLTAGYTVVT